MTKLFANKFVVLGMAVTSAIFIYLRIVAPMLPENYDDVPVVEFPDLEEELAAANIDPDTDVVQPRLKLATAQFDLRNIDVGLLQFNENPQRDPFVNAPIEVAPLAAVKIIAAAPVKKTTAVRAAPLPQLTAVVHSKNQTAAVIDNRIVRQGDRVGRYQVQSILRDHVVLASASSNHSVKLRVTP